MAEVKHCKRKNGLDLDYNTLFDDDDDDRLPELLIVPSSDKSKAKAAPQTPCVDYRTKTDDELKTMILKYKHNLGPMCKDNREKLEAEIQRRRRRNHPLKDDGEPIQLSTQTDDGRNDKKSSTFAHLFANKIDANERTANAFHKEMSFFNPHQNDQVSDRGTSNQPTPSRLKQFQSPITLVDKKLTRSSAFSPQQFYHTNQPSTKFKPKPPTSYNLMDEEGIEDPDDFDTTPYAEKLSSCMKDVKVYYPSREDRDPVEVIYTDMECLAPEACLSSTVMNFYIRYLQQSSSENRGGNFHFFNTYFYHKLQKLNHQEDSFLKFRKWWKGVNIFEKAYILLPIHESAHWSLGIICIPTKKDELGPIVLHLDSLGLHDSKLIFDNVGRFVKEEWSHVRNSEDPFGLPITDEIWENLDQRIINSRIEVPQQRNAYDCGLFVLYYMERFIKEAPERLKEKDLSMFGKQWFLPKEASNLRWRIKDLLVKEFKTAKKNEAVLSPKC